MVILRPIYEYGVGVAANVQRAPLDMTASPPVSVMMIGTPRRIHKFRPCWTKPLGFSTTWVFHLAVLWKLTMSPVRWIGGCVFQGRALFPGKSLQWSPEITWYKTSNHCELNTLEPTPGAAWCAFEGRMCPLQLLEELPLRTRRTSLPKGGDAMGRKALPWQRYVLVPTQNKQMALHNTYSCSITIFWFFKSSHISWLFFHTNFWNFAAPHSIIEGTLAQNGFFSRSGPARCTNIWHTSSPRPTWESGNTTPVTGAINW